MNEPYETSNFISSINSGRTFAGGYEIGGKYGLKIMLAKKPFWLHRKMAEWFFGFIWVDEEKK